MTSKNKSTRLNKFKSDEIYNLLTINHCLDFRNNPHIHPLFGTPVLIDSPEYYQLIDACGKKLADGIVNGMPILSPKQQKKAEKQREKEEKLMEEKIQQTQHILQEIEKSKNVLNQKNMLFR